MVQLISLASHEEAKRMIDTHPEALILDVREEEEYYAGHLDGAELLTLDTIDEETAAFVIPSKDTLLLLYCKSGRRSMVAAKMLSELGYKNIINLGGLIGWPYELV